MTPTNEGGTFTYPEKILTFSVERFLFPNVGRFSMRRIKVTESENSSVFILPFKGISNYYFFANFIKVFRKML